MSDDPTQMLNDSAYLVNAKRERPLLVLYYPGAQGHMMVEDADDAYRHLREAGITKETAMTTTHRERRRGNNKQTDTLKEHLEMFERRREHLKRTGNLTFKEALDKVNNPMVYRRARTK